MRRGTWGLVSLLLLASACSPGGEEIAVERAPLATSTTATTEAAPVEAESAGDAVETEITAAPTTTAAPATTAPPPAPPPPAAASTDRAPWTIEPYRGFGAWLDAYDWSRSFSRSDPVGLEAIDHMAAEGVETIYIQATRWNSPTDILERDRLEALITRAHQHGMAVVGWYLPTLTDQGADLRRMLAMAELDLDGLAVDIEARDVADVAERNKRLVELSAALRQALPGAVIGGIVLEPVLIEDVNPNYWPSFPWAEIAPYYDVWLPMSYWTNRRGEWRSAHTYTATNIVRVRERIGQPDAPVHTIGGIGDLTSVGDLREMVTASVEHRAIGGSIYDYRTSRQEFWDVLRSFRSR